MTDYLFFTSYFYISFSWQSFLGIRSYPFLPLFYFIITYLIFFILRSLSNLIFHYSCLSLPPLLTYSFLSFLPLFLILTSSYSFYSFIVFLPLLFRLPSSYSYLFFLIFSSSILTSSFLLFLLTLSHLRLLFLLLSSSHSSFLFLYSYSPLFFSLFLFLLLHHLFIGSILPSITPPSLPSLHFLSPFPPPPLPSSTFPPPSYPHPSTSPSPSPPQHTITLYLLAT